LKRLILKPALLHQLLPTDCFFQVGVDPPAQLIEKLFVNRDQPLFPVVGISVFEEHHFKMIQMKVGHHISNFGDCQWYVLKKRRAAVMP